MIILRYVTMLRRTRRAACSASSLSAVTRCLSTLMQRAALCARAVRYMLFRFIYDADVAIATPELPLRHAMLLFSLCHAASDNKSAYVTNMVDAATRFPLLSFSPDRYITTE